MVISGYATRLPTGVLPLRLADAALRRLAQAYPSVEPAGDGLSGALMNAGPIIHPPLILMNAGPLQHFERWDIHNEGTQPAIRAVTDALDAERVALREALGYGAPHFPLADHYAQEGDEWMYGRGAHGRLTDSGDWRETIDLHRHRYMLEDTRLGLSFLVSTGRWAGVPMAQAAGLASALTGRDLYAEGRTLENLGLSALSRADMRAAARGLLRWPPLCVIGAGHGTGHRRVLPDRRPGGVTDRPQARAADEQARVHDAPAWPCGRAGHARAAGRAERGPGRRRWPGCGCARGTMRPPTCARRARCSRPCPNAWTPSATRCAGWMMPAGRDRRGFHTSTFLVTELAALTAHPERFLNAHWLNPASLIPLVEVSRGPATAMPPPTSCWICCAWRARRR